MATRTSIPLPALYHEDETAWLEAMARLAADRRLDELDCVGLSEYLSDMARRDRREVFRRLVILLAHLLKWEFQPGRRSNSWRGTILAQRRELRLLLESRTLRNHAVAILPEAFGAAREQAAAETGLPLATFPTSLDRTLDDLLARDPEIDPS